MRRLYGTATQLVLAAGLTLLPLAAHADMPGRHPYYMHALSNLRAASWMLEHRPGDAAVSGEEDVAIQQIEAAYREIKRAALEDGKDLHEHPSAQIPPDYRGRLHQTVDLLREVRADLDHEEDDPEARGLKHRAIDHVDGALHATEHAIHDIERGR